MVTKNVNAMKSHYNNIAIQRKKRRKEIKEHLKDSITLKGKHDSTTTWMENYFSKKFNTNVICLGDKNIDVYFLKTNKYNSSTSNNFKEVTLNPKDITYKFTIDNIDIKEYGSYKFIGISNDLENYLLENHPQLMI